MCVGNAFERRVPTWTFSPYGLAPIFVAVSIINIQYNMTYKKNIGSTAKFIHELTQDKVTIPNSPFEKKEGQFVFNKSLLSFLLYPRDDSESLRCLFLNPTWYDSLEVNMKSGSYVVSQTSLELPNRFIEGDSYTCSVQFDRLIDPQWDEKTQYFYRYFLPIKNERWLSFIEHIPCYQDDDIPSTYDSYRCVGGIRVDLSKERQIHLFSVYMGASLFLAIESQFPCTYGEMSDYMHTISLSLGLVTSVAPFDYAYIVASETPDFEGKIMSGMIRLRPTIKNKYCFFFMTDLDVLFDRLRGKADYTLHQLRDENGKAKSRLDPMTEEEFSALARMLYENKELARAALMLIDSSMNLECLGAISAVALETICSVLIEANKELLPKHRNKKGKERRSNEEKLTEPFMLPQIGYELSEEKGKELVNIRNSFLHGGVLGFSHTEYHKLQYPCMKLRCFCGILLLRYAGYKGPILNNAVALGLEEAIENEEPLFITYDEEAAKELVEKRKKEKQKEEEKKKKQSQGKEKSPQPTEKPEASV